MFLPYIRRSNGPHRALTPEVDTALRAGTPTTRRSEGSRWASCSTSASET